MNRKTRKLVIATLATGLLAGCNQDGTAFSAAQAASSPLVKHIPAQTPYLAANFEPIPDEVNDKLWGALVPGLETAQEQVSAMIGALEEKDTLDQQDKLLLALLREADGRISREGLTELGIGAHYYALYGDGAVPVARVDLTDRDALLAAIGRVQEAAGTAFPVLERGEVSYFEIRDPTNAASGAVYVALLPDQLAVTVALPGPVENQNAALDRLLGEALPEENAVARMATANERYGYLPFGTGVLAPSALLDELLKLFERFQPEKAAELSAACRTDLRRLASAVPEIASGYTSLTQERIGQSLVVRFVDELIPGLKSLATPMKGLVRVDEGALYFAYGLDLMNVKAFAGERVAAMQANPLKCEHFAEAMGQLDVAAAQLAQPMPPFVGNLKGLRLLAEDIDIGPNGQPRGGKAVAAIMMDNPQLMLGMGQAFVPELAEFKLTPDGKPQPLPEGLLPPGTVTGPVWLAMIQEGFGASIGEGMEARLPGFLDDPAPDSDDAAPLMIFSYDMAALMEIQQGMIRSATSAMGDSAEAGELEALEAELEAAMGDYYEILGRLTVETLVSDQGLEIRSEALLD